METILEKRTVKSGVAVSNMLETDMGEIFRLAKTGWKAVKFYKRYWKLTKKQKSKINQQPQTPPAKGEQKYFRFHQACILNRTTELVLVSKTTTKYTSLHFTNNFMIFFCLSKQKSILKPSHISSADSWSADTWSDGLLGGGLI